MPISGRTARASATTSCPQIAARPAVGSRTVDSIFTRVVLPAPLGPNRPWTSPCGMASEMPSSARTGGFFRTVNSRTSSTTSTAGGMAVTVTGSHVRPPPISARSVPSTLGGVTDEPETVLDAPVAAVTVYTDGARVTRRGALRLPAGEQRVVVDRLPLGLHPDSVRVSGRGPATVLGVDLVRRHHARTPDEAAAALEQRRRAADGALAEPTYDIRLDSDRLALTWYALVSQRTGEDWPECELLLSTARPSGAVTVPELGPWYLDRIRP